jgi:hypothetical protein
VAFASSRGGGAGSRPSCVDCKPGPVPTSGCPGAGEDHSSRRRVATALEHSNPGTARALADVRSGGPPSTVPLFKLAPGRACLAAGRPAVARGLLPHDFTLTGSRPKSPKRPDRACRSFRRSSIGSPARRAGPTRRYHFCCAFPRVTPGRCYRLPCPVEPGLSSRGRCLSAGDLPSTSGAQRLCVARPIGNEPPRRPPKPCRGRGFRASLAPGEDAQIDSSLTVQYCPN